MYNRNLGDQIRDIVEDAVDSCNFHDLNNKIKNTADRAIDEFNHATQGFQYDNGRYRDRDRSRGRRRENHGPVPPFMGGGPGFGQAPNEGPFQGGFHGHQGQPFHGENDRYRKVASSWTVQPPFERKKKRRGIPGAVSSILLTVFGGITFAGFGITSIVLFIVAAAMGTVTGVLPLLGSIFFVAAALSGSAMGIGISKRKRIKRYNRYDEIIGPNNYCEIKKLAEQSGRTEKYVIKDLQKMILLGYFKEGHIDESKTCFIIDDRTYQQYLEVMENYKEKQKQKAEQKKQEDLTNVDPELKKAIESGREYIGKIKQANDDIPGEEISRKLDQLEDIVSKVFICVEKHPNKLPEIRKFMEYYLPITLKLVNAYKEFDAQPIQGDNITKSKKEIEDTIDTINAAFVKLLDSLYEEEAMEIASDISVLNTLFAQEGLTKKDFDLR